MDSVLFGKVIIGGGFVLFPNRSYRIPSKAISSIVRLFKLRSPSTVLGTVSKSIVDSVNGKVFLVSVCQSPSFERFKGRPLITNLDAFGSVTKVSTIIRVVASLAHDLPYFVKSSSTRLMSGKSFLASTWATVKALMGVICAPLKDFLTAKASKLKVFSINHKASYHVNHT